MATRRTMTRDGQTTSTYDAGIQAIEQRLEVPQEFPAEVLEAAQEAVRRGPRPDDSRVDRTEVPLVTIDPEGAKDLDQAMHIERHGDGFRVCYAIADVAAWVDPGGPIDLDAHRRGETLYAPDHRVPLHPPALSEAAASLLPGQDCPVLLWHVDLDADGEGTTIEVERATVRSREQHDYVGVQQMLDAGTAPEVFALLREVGELRIARERDRGGVNLDLPEQDVLVGDDGTWSLAFRRLEPVERWNAQISLMVGMGAAEMMLYAQYGILRTLPPADDRDVQRLRRTAAALGFDWPAGMHYSRFIPTVDVNTPAGAAMLTACTRLLRGAGYVAFREGVPDHPEHAAIAHAYTHCTAPLRRLVDRYTGEICVSLCTDEPVPAWVEAAMDALPQEMADAGRRGSAYERSIVDLVEAGVLAPRVGDTFTGVVTTVDDEHPETGTVMLREPAVEAPLRGADRLPLGEQVTVRLVEADQAEARVAFEIA